MNASACPVCGAAALEPFLDLAAVPVLATVFHDTRDQATGAPRGDLRLALCHGCALVWNEAFDPGRVEYTTDYENSLHFSPAFQAFAGELSARLARDHELAGRTVVEVGSGKGEFLAMLCRAADCRGIGFDPTFDGEVDDPDVEVVRTYYDVDAGKGIDAALVVARHVLEHLADPVVFLRDLRSAARERTALYVEVPNAQHVFSDAGMWDLIYQHVGYYTPPALATAVGQAGYSVTDLRPAFHDQFLSVEATPSRSSAVAPPDAATVERTCVEMDGFAGRLRARLDRWREDLAGRRSGEVVLWGAGAKSVAFVNLLGLPDAVDQVVDINPRKHGRYLPGTGHRVEAPVSLTGRRLAAVLTTNATYEREIRAELDDLGSAAPILAV